ncbi:MAG: hypothetical protein IT381_05900 [Deltaproteobacteria bacterium]|nr:hypothetical protein [Deltaproteobacteria bacterium]
MKAAVAVLVVLSATTSFAAKAEKSDKSDDEKTVAHATLDKLVAALNAGDANAFMSGFIEEGVVGDPFGRTGKGKADATKIIVENVNTLLQGTKSKATLEGARKLGHDAILIDASVEHENALMLNGSRGTGGTRWTLALVKKGKTWMVTDLRLYMFWPPPPPAPAK